MENGPFIDDFPSYKPPFMVGIFHGYISHNQMVYVHDIFMFAVSIILVRLVAEIH